MTEADEMTPTCPHPDDAIHWHPPKSVPGPPGEGPVDGKHLVQGGICRRCRQPMLRHALTVTWSDPEPVALALPQPRVEHERHRQARRRFG